MFIQNPILNASDYYTISSNDPNWGSPWVPGGVTGTVEAVVVANPRALTKEEPKKDKKKHISQRSKRW